MTMQVNGRNEMTTTPDKEELEMIAAGLLDGIRHELQGRRPQTLARGIYARGRRAGRRRLRRRCGVSTMSKQERRIKAMTQAIVDTVQRAQRGDDDIGYVFSALLNAFSSYAADLSPERRETLFRTMRESQHQLEEMTEKFAQQNTGMLARIPAAGRA
jgi:hypothetical protein